MMNGRHGASSHRPATDTAYDHQPKGPERGNHSHGSYRRDDRYTVRGRGGVQRTDRPSTNEPLRAHWDPITSSSGRQRSDRTRTAKKRSPFGNFLAAYGWRAYAIPVLVVLTVLLVVNTIHSGFTARHTSAQSSDAQSGSQTRDTNIAKQSNVVGALAPGANQNLPTGVLPDGGPYTQSGQDSWHEVPGTTARVGQGKQQTFKYTIEVENGIDPSNYGGDEAFGKTVDAILDNKQSWTHDPNIAFQRIDSGKPNFRISLTTPMTTRALCGYDIKLESSCYDPEKGRVVINLARWVRGALAFQGDLGLYRQYQINHEVGHAIGYARHEPCKKNGALAPIMMQQTFGVADDQIYSLDPEGVVPRDGKVCRPNAWPYPASG